jgi:alpha-galactosidase
VPPADPLLELSNGPTTAILQTTGGGMPRLRYLGHHVRRFDPAALDRPLPKASLNEAPPLGLVTEHAAGFEGRPGLLGARPDGSGWAPRFDLADPDSPFVREAPNRGTFLLRDPVAQLELKLVVEVTGTGALLVDTELTNISTDQPFQVLRLSPSIPLPADAAEFLAFTGRWCREFQPERHQLAGTFVVENRHGRTSHERLPAIIAGTADFGEHHGRVLGLQLAWSGNYELAVERLVDDYRHVQAGELLWPGEVNLEPGEQYRAPTVIACWSDTGLQELSRRFHAHIRTGLDLRGPRKVLLNTWEAVYFDHDLTTLTELVEAAADVGVERFVLDDGWFGSRRNDTSGLGDWTVSEQAWPDGLDPLIKRVHAHGMDFGLWVEPEMVNPDSDLFRTHPEWALVTDGYEPLLARNQLVLDFGRPAVRDYIVESLNDLLDRYDIAYLKWDMNRRMVQGSGSPNQGSGPGSGPAHTDTSRASTTCCVVFATLIRRSRSKAVPPVGPESTPPS